jgi:hypothetical protein
MKAASFMQSQLISLGSVDTYFLEVRYAEISLTCGGIAAERSQTYTDIYSPIISIFILMDQ